MAQERPLSRRVVLLSRFLLIAHFASWIFFFLALAMPVFYLANGPVLGLLVLLIGWLDIVGLQGVAWLANLLIVTSSILIVCRRYDGAAIVSLVALLMAATAFFKQAIPGDDGFHAIVGYGTGFYGWLTAITVNFLTCLGLYAVRKPFQTRQKDVRLEKHGRA
jgi:hypothetical protein